MGLVDIQKNNDFVTDKDKHGYLEYYDQSFYQYRDQKIQLLEIGIFKGGSLMLWNSYFRNCQIYGIDKDLSNIEYRELKEADNVVLIEKDVDTITENIFRDMKFDIIIDDGSHTFEHQLKTMYIFKNKLANRGMLIIEDIQNMINMRKVISGRHETFKYGFELVDFRKGHRDDSVLLVHKNHPKRL